MCRVTARAVQMRCCIVVHVKVTIGLVHVFHYSVRLDDNLPRCYYPISTMFGAKRPKFVGTWE
jgi:hypothetical protein